MIGKILFSLVAFLLFIYIFIVKLIKKNDTTYLIIMICQAVGILLIFMQNLFNIFVGIISNIIITILCIIIPIIVLVCEIKGINFSEVLSIIISKICLIIGKRKIAKSILVDLVSKYNDSYEGHKMLAEVYVMEGGVRKAIDEYVKVLDIKNDDYKTYFTISKLLNDSGKKDEAIEMLKILVKKKPELNESNKMLSDLYLEKEKFKEAINIYIQAIKYNSEDAWLYYKLGIAYARINEFSLAKECFIKATEVDSNLYNSYYRLGQIALLYRDIEEAEQYFLQSMYGETEIKSFYQLAKIYMIKNDKTKVMMYLNKAVENSNEYYKKIIEDPMFFAIKDKLNKPGDGNEIKESEEEKIISDYLDNTYLLTNQLNKEEKKKKKNKFSI